MPQKEKENPATPKLEALGERVIIKQDPAEIKTRGRLLLPETAQKKPTRGIVVASGPGLTTVGGQFIPNITKAGDRVLWCRWRGDALEFDGEEYVVQLESDLLAVLED